MSRLSLTMDDDLKEIIKKMAEKEWRSLNNQAVHLIKLGLKSVEREIEDEENGIKHTVKIPEGWEVVRCVK